MPIDNINGTPQLDGFKMLIARRQFNTTIRDASLEELTAQENITRDYDNKPGTVLTVIGRNLDLFA